MLTLCFLQPISTPVLGSLVSSSFEIGGRLHPQIGYTFKYGAPENQPAQFDLDKALIFMLDFDYWSQDIDSISMMSTLDQFHDKHFDFFWWTLSEESRRLLEKGV